jgi:hypothetical protein
MLHQATSTLNVTCLVNEVGMSFVGLVAGTSWQAGDLSQGKRPHSYQGMIAAAGKQIHGSRTRPQTA